MPITLSHRNDDRRPHRRRESADAQSSINFQFRSVDVLAGSVASFWPCSGPQISSIAPGLWALCRLLVWSQRYRGV